MNLAQDSLSISIIFIRNQISQPVKMPKYIIERNMPGAGKLSMAELSEAAKKSCCCLNEMDSSIQWVHSYATEDKIYCLYIAPNKEMIEEHGRKSGFPCNSISEVSYTFDADFARGCCEK